MRLSRFYKLFPVPRYLEFSAVGIDISDESIKFTELVYSLSSYRLGVFGEASLPPGTVVGGKIVNRDNLIQSLREIKHKHNFTFVHASLPEEETFVVRMNVPEVKLSELANSIELQLEDYIPLPADQVVFDYEIYSQPDDCSRDYILGVSIAPRSLVSDYTSVFQEAGLELVSLEIEVQSVARSLVPPYDHKTYLIVDIGKTRTSFSIVSRGVMLFSSTIGNIGGDNLTKSIQRSLNVSYEQAEELKIKKGLLSSATNKEVFESLIPVVSAFKDEMSKHYTYWKNLKQDEIAVSEIDKILLCGGQSTLPGLIDYLSASFVETIEIGNPWSSFWTKGQGVPPLNFNDSLRYATAIGLSLRGINYHLL